MAAEDIGALAVKISMDNTGFQQGISMINKNLKILDSEFKSNTSALGANGKGMDGLKLKTESLAKSIELQKLKVATLSSAYDKSVASKGADARATQDLEIKTNIAKAALSKMESQLTATNKTIDIQSSKWTAMGKNLNTISTKLKPIGEGFTSVGTKLTMGVTVPVVGAIVASAKLASDLAESMNKVEVCFGASAAGVEAWSKTTLKSFGIAQGSALDSVSNFGDMATSMGLPSIAAAAMSEKLVGLSGDLASFKNIGISEANDALTGIFTGETKSLKSLGIVMTIANLQDFAATKGIKTKVSAMTEAEQVQLRYNYVLSKTSNAQGDFIRTGSGTANSARVFGESLKELGETMGKNVLPVVTPVIQKLSQLAESFGKMSPEAQKTVLTFAVVASAIGPLSIGLGSMLSVGSSLAGMFGGLAIKMGLGAAATEGVGVAATGAGVATTGLGTAFLGVLAPIAPFAIALGAIGLTAYGVHKVLTEKVTPSVDLFANKVTSSSNALNTFSSKVDQANGATIKISDATKKAVGAYMDMDNGVSKSMLNMNVSVGKLTKAQVTDVEKQFADMGIKIKAGMDTKNAADLTTMKTFLDKSHTLTAEDEKLVLKNINDNNTANKGQVDAYNAQINAIYAKALSEHRKVTVDEQTQINTIQNTMRTTGVKTLSDSEVESKVILARMASYGANITAQQASDVIKSANKQRDGSISAANSQYDKTVKAIIRQRDEAGTITADQAAKMIKDAGKQRDQTISAAETQRKSVVKKITDMNSDIGKSIDTTTGNAITSWQKMADFWNTLKFDIKTFFTKTVALPGSGVSSKASGGYDTGVTSGKTSSSIKSRANASGNNNFEGGLTTLHENGYEVYNLPQHTKIYNHEASEDLVVKTAQQVAKGVLDTMTNVKQSATDGLAITFDHVVINGYNDVKKLLRDFYNIQQNHNKGKGAI